LNIINTLNLGENMKKVLVIVLLGMLLSMLSAVDFDISGTLRTRAALRNNPAEKDGGEIDSRFQLGLDSELAEGLKLHAMFEVGDLTWGGNGGGLSTGGVNVETNELYIDYYVPFLDANIRAGQQWWADHRSLILDDYFSGIVISKENVAGMKAEFGFLKLGENVFNPMGDRNAFMANFQGESPIPFGILALGSYYSNRNEGNVTFMPYATLQAGPATLDITPFIDYQMFPGDNDEMGFGAAVKADMDMGGMQLGADVLFATEHGLSTLSPWYQNGLYIYGIGANHDGVNLYWGTPYSGNADTFVSAVGKLRAPIKENLTAFAAAGMLTDMGWEVNGGVEYNVYEDLMKVSAFGAFANGTEGTKPANYVIGSSLNINF
jgi:hypothetical protein